MKLEKIKTGDTITDSKNPLTLKGLNIARPCISKAIAAVKKGDTEKIGQGINRLMEEDPTLGFRIDKETKDQILSGLGEQHLDVVIAKLKSKFGVNAILEEPKIAYRETIRKTVKVQGKYKKQSGGHGQYGDVWIRFEPCESETLVFEEEVFGGAVPKNYFPAVEKGLEEAVKHGVLAGYPVVGLKAVLYDGSYHPVDSSEMAFKTAASFAYKEGMKQANPILLEPVLKVTVNVPDDNMGDLMGDITKRRGQVLGMDQVEGRKGIQQLIAEVPESEMGDFSTFLRSVTKGRGSFETEFARYSPCPEEIAEKVIEEAKE